MTKTERINLKAKELVEKFALTLRVYSPSWVVESKQCALVCIDEQLKTLSNIDTSFNDDIAEEVYQAEKELELIKERIKS